MKKILYVLLVLVVSFLIGIFCRFIVSNVFASEDVNQPTLFGMKWGASVEECQQNGMMAKEPAMIDGSLHTYVDFNNDNRKIGDIRIASVSYGFFDGKLSSIYIVIDKQNVFNPERFYVFTRKALKLKYGDPTEQMELFGPDDPNAGETSEWNRKVGDVDVWVIQEVGIYLEFNSELKEGGLLYLHFEYMKDFLKE